MGAGSSTRRAPLHLHPHPASSHLPRLTVICTKIQLFLLYPNVGLIALGAPAGRGAPRKQGSTCGSRLAQQERGRSPAVTYHPGALCLPWTEVRQQKTIASYWPAFRQPHRAAGPHLWSVTPRQPVWDVPRPAFLLPPAPAACSPASWGPWSPLTLGRAMTA